MSKNLSVKFKKKNSNTKIAVIIITTLLIIGIFLPSINKGINNIFDDKHEITEIKGEILEKTDIFTLPVGGSDSWWNDDWQYRKNITIDHTKVAGELINFPVLINLDSDNDLSSHAQPDGDDIVFVDFDGNKLNHEIELFDSSTGALVVWVNVSYLSDTYDTYLSLYYGNNICNNQQNTLGTWDSNYKIVQHLNEEIGDYSDSTIFGNNGILTDDNYSSIRGIDGKIGKAVHLSGDADYIDCGGDGSMGSTSYWTVTGWVNFDDLTTQVLWNRDIISDFTHGISAATDHILVGYGGDPRNRPNMASVLESGTWYHWAITCDDINNNIHFYLNGVNQTLIASSNFGSGQSGTFRIGSRLSGNPYFFNGFVDEVRILDVEASESWINTSYNAMSSPESFISIGYEQVGTINEKPIVFKSFPLDGASSVDVSISELYFNLTDYQGDLMDYSVETSPDIGHDSVNGVENGTYYVQISGLEYDTVYTWYVNVSDTGGHWANETFSFTTISFDTNPPIIIQNFAGNPNDNGGPYFIPETENLADDGYYTNDSHQQENWMYINCTVTDSGSDVNQVWLHWLNETTWTNESYQFISTGNNYYEFNTMGNITDIASGYNYSFDIWANDSFGNNYTYQWTKRGADNSTGNRIHVQLAGTPADVSYIPYYLNSADYSAGTSGNGYGGVPSPYNADVLHHDQGPDGTTTDTGYLLADTPTDIVEERYCAKYTGYWFDETITAPPDTLENIYYHNWWSTLSKTVEFGYGKTRTGIYNNDYREQYFDVSNETACSQLSYNDREYYLEASLMDINSPLSLGDNDIYEFFINHFTFFNDNPTIINNRSIMSFVIFNVPDDVTLQSLDTDNDNLDDYTELYFTYTSPFTSDTDNDGVNDYIEYNYGSDPNNYTDTVIPPDKIYYKISLNGEWNLVSMPVNQSIYKDDITINVLDVNYTWDEAVDIGIILDFIYEWNGQSYYFVDVITPGNGYWIYSYIDCDLVISVNEINNDSQITDLGSEWNLMGLPFNESVLKDDLIVFYSGTNYTWDEAVSSGIILNYIYNWDGSAYLYVETLDPAKGYWMYSYCECTLKKQEM